MHLVCLHNVIAGDADPFDQKCSRISVAEFERFLDAVAETRNLISYSAYEALLRAGAHDPDAVALSFDDGFLGVFEFAAPVLAARGLDAVAFVNPPFLGNPGDRIHHFLELEIAFRLSDCESLTVPFWDEPFDLSQTKSRIRALKRVKKLLKTRPEAERIAGHAEVLGALGVPQADILRYAKDDPKFRIMDAVQLRALHEQGWTIGSHSMSHRTLSMLPQDALEAEIGDAARYLATEFGWTNLPFAYPYGDRIHVGTAPPEVCARAGHPLAYTTVPGRSDFAHAPHLLPRIDYKVFLREFELLGAA